MSTSIQRRIAAPRGATSVEFAFTAPILFFLAMGAVEFSRAYVIYHTCEIAAAEGAREGILPGATAADCQAAATRELAIIGVSDYEVAVSPTEILPSTETVSVTTRVPMTMANGYILPQFFLGRTITKTITLPREQSIN